MSLVPADPVWTSVVSVTSVVPTCRMPEYADPKEMESLSESEQQAVRAWQAMGAEREILMEQALQQKERTADRCSTEQWLDENEREWYALDALLSSRPWATRKDTPMTYPFRTTTNEMREAEGPWLGDEKDPPKQRKWTRGEAPCATLTHARPVVEFPPSDRVLLFLPEFGSDKSFQFPGKWGRVTPIDSCDIWTVSWQGWTDFDEMINQVKHQVLSFADGVSTVWFGHSMGAIVAYEVLKRFEKHHSPNLPTALIVSGCPAPHLFQEQYRPQEKYAWLGDLKEEADLDKLTPEQAWLLSREFQVVPQELATNFVAIGAQEARALPLSAAQKQVIIKDLQVMRSYRCKHEKKARAAVIPVVALCHDQDELVSSSAVEEWREYTCPGSEFECVALEDYEDGAVLAEQGHGYTIVPSPTLLSVVSATCTKHRVQKDIEDILPDIGSVHGPVPEAVDCLVVGAGIAGIGTGNVMAESGMSVLVVDRQATIGGIWMYYANNFSRVNSSEPAYRTCNQEGPGTRPNEDHSPRHDILRDLFTVAATRLKGKFRCNQDVTKVTKQSDGSYAVFLTHVTTGKVSLIRAKTVSFNVNRRLGKRRDLTWPGHNQFRGQEVYGYANEVLGLNLWGKRVVVVGAGAFAFENLRTSLEHGAKHATILGRRAGTTCPKWIDMIAFIRPTAADLSTNKTGNVISFDCWRKCYENAGLPTPECWDEGLLKPHNHTVSVSDLAYIGGYHGAVALLVGEINNYSADGQGIHLKDGRRLDADVIIKATGFHLNEEVPKICGGYDKIHPFAFLDYNLAYGAEPLLDGGQFGSQKGQMEVVDENEAVSDEAMYKGWERAQNLDLPDVALTGNPFGSAYVGGMLTVANYYKWLVLHPEHQKALFEVSGKPTFETCKLWASQSGKGKYAAIKRCANMFTK